MQMSSDEEPLPGGPGCFPLQVPTRRYRELVDELVSPLPAAACGKYREASFNNLKTLGLGVRTGSIKCQ
jgi:hypothetical protein